MKFSRVLILLLLLIPAGHLIALDATGDLKDPAQQALYERLVDEVRCLVCQNQTIGDSNAPLASDLRREIRERISQGQTENEIKDFLTERYGDFVLYRPRFAGPGTLLWLAPGLLLLVGLLALGIIVRRRAKLPVSGEAEDAIDGTDSGWS